MNPRISELQTFFTALSARRDLANLIEMRTFRCHVSSCFIVPAMNRCYRSDGGRFTYFSSTREPLRSGAGQRVYVFTLHAPCGYLTSGLGSGTKPFRFGICMVGSECASITASSAIILFWKSSQAMTEYTSSGVSDCGALNGMARLM
jgi:hypothetical protein